jgi:hypothetical protein
VAALGQKKTLATYQDRFAASLQLLIAILGLALRIRPVSMAKFDEKAGVLGSDEILLVTRTNYRFHCGRVEQAVFDEMLVNMYADDLTEGDEPWGWFTVNILEPNGL